MADEALRERMRWNELYRRALDTTIVRPAAEVESVPIPGAWGTLPPAEWEAQAFLLPYLERSRRWLDLGCATGSVLAAFLARYPDATAVGIDASDIAVSHGTSILHATPRLPARLVLVRGDLKAPDVDGGPFDLIFALFSLQFLRLSEFYELLSTLGSGMLANPGAFAATVRSTSRSVPASYVLDANEPNTYLSREPHEQNMCYHHYCREEIERAAEVVGGRVAYLHEIFAHRAYDPAPRRAWWNFVIARP